MAVSYTHLQAHAVDKRKIERFFASDLYKTFMAENKVRREFKFSVLCLLYTSQKRADAAARQRTAEQSAHD